MIVQSEVELLKISKKINSFFDFDLYTDFLFPEDFNCGFSFHNFTSVRFSNEPNIIKEIVDFLPQGEYYVIPIVKDTKSVYRMYKDEMEMFLNKNPVDNFIIAELKLTWLLVYDKHRKLFGLGSYIRKQMKKKINLRFGNAKIMFFNSSME